MKKGLFILALILAAVNASAYQRFIHLTSKDVTIDSVMPTVGYILPLTGDVADSVYTVSVVYPEFIDMTEADIKAYHRLSNDSLPEIPLADMYIAYDRKKPVMYMEVVPMAKNEGKYKWLTSFMLRIESTARTSRPQNHKISGAHKASGTETDYADHSVLASGKWAKIRVDHTGLFELTDALIRKAGFSDISKVKVYGYGGNLQPEAIAKSYLHSTDDLQEIPQYVDGGKHLFYGKGPVYWNTTTDYTRIRNPYSDYGYYFLTEGDTAPYSLDASAFMETLADVTETYHDLYEVDDFAWYRGGRNLYDSEALALNATRDYTFTNKAHSSSAKFYVNVSSSVNSVVNVSINGVSQGDILIFQGSYDKAHVSSASIQVDDLGDENTVTLKVTSGYDVHLDYISVVYGTPWEYSLTESSYSVPEYVETVANQDHHADGPVDMVVIIPESQLTLSEAQRLMEYHKVNDSDDTHEFSYRIVPANELYNEFSSGTPDANAYRRYLKMMYDRSPEESIKPDYLLLFGNCVWDNRMHVSELSKLDPKDYLLCFESENSTNEVNCYVDDGWFTLLDEGEGVNPQSKDKQDVAVGRFPVTSLSEANILTTKVINYMDNVYAGKWQNTIVCMGDDGNENLHMSDANDIANNILTLYPQYDVKKLMWDAFERVTSASGNTYPSLTKVIKQYQKEGVLIMDYSGHGSPTQMSHEQVLRISDFRDFNNYAMPLWITASCDIMPFDSYEDNIGVTSLLNENGGSCAFFGTTRTVYANYNKQINLAFTERILKNGDDGKPLPLGEAQRQTKNYLIETGKDTSRNKLQFSLLGDPAMALVHPDRDIEIDSINGVDLSSGAKPTINAGGKMHITGHIVTPKDSVQVYGTVYLTIYDTEQTVVCRMNDTSETSTAFTYDDRSNVLFKGSADVVRDTFEITVTVPLDINYSDKVGRIVAYAVSHDKLVTAHGYNEDFYVGGTDPSAKEERSPSVFCYLNKTSFQDGDVVNPSPMFYAQISDESGINVSGSGIGHDLTLIIDGDMNQTYNLNDNFVTSDDSQTSGTTYYSLSGLSEGSHSLEFRAWDIYNNVSISKLNFVVSNQLAPDFINLESTSNPATSTTTFIVTHDRIGVVLNTKLEVMDMSGRLLWVKELSNTYDEGVAEIPWDLTTESGGIQTGVYLYRVTLSTQDSDYSSKAKKLIVIR